MKKFAVVLLLIFIYSVQVSATPQIPDRIIYNGVEYDLLDINPFESYLKNHPEKDPNGKLLLYGGVIGLFLKSKKGNYM